MTPKPLTIVCTACGGEGSLYTSRYGGNDPDVWRTGPCDRCEETGYEILRCNHCGDADAVEWVQSDELCAACAATAKANVFVVGEDVP